MSVGIRSGRNSTADLLKRHESNNRNGTYIWELFDGDVDLLGEIGRRPDGFGQHHRFLLVAVDLEQVSSHFSYLCNSKINTVD